MFNVKITGFDDIQKMLDEVKRALEALHGEVATLRVDPNNPQLAIAEMERLVDAKVATYRGNEIVEQIVEESKKAFRDGILEQAAETKRNG